MLRIRTAHWHAGHAAGGLERAHATTAMITPAPMAMIGIKERAAHTFAHPALTPHPPRTHLARSWSY
jgi:hypothetical protein